MSGAQRFRLFMVVLLFFAFWLPLPALAAPAGPTDLGDLGYYYSEAGPFWRSTVSVFNPGDVYTEAQITLRNDIGTAVYTATQTIAPGEQWHFAPADAGLHGVFHGDVRSKGDPLSVYVSIESADGGEQAGLPVATPPGYAAVPASVAADSLTLGELMVMRGPGSRQTEIVVQNLHNRSNQVIFTFCPADGRCFANNVAVLPAFGRRSFLLSNLAYSNRYGDSLVMLSGAMIVSLSAEPNKPIAVVANSFETNAAAKAELGALDLVQISADGAGISGLGTPSDSLNGTIPQLNHPIYVPSVMGTYQSRTSRTCPLPGGEGEWPCGAHEDVLWHLPFVAAPNLAFVENTESLLGVGYPWQGIQETGRSLDAWPEMANLNWYNWMANANWSANLNRELWTLCERDPNYFPMVWSATVSRNTVPSSCAGRPLLLVNEPVLQRHITPTWTDDAIADNVFRHRNWPGDLYCCGHTSWPADLDDRLSANATNWPTFGNILDAYQERFGAKLPIDGVHVHFYLTSSDVDVTRQAPKTSSLEIMRSNVRTWVSYIANNFGSDFPVIVSEFGVLSGGPNEQVARDVVKAGLGDFTHMLVGELGDHLVRMHYFQVYWGGGADPNRPNWLVGSDDGAYPVEEVNDLGEYYLDLVDEYKR